MKSMRILEMATVCAALAAGGCSSLDDLWARAQGTATDPDAELLSADGGEALPNGETPEPENDPGRPVAEPSTEGSDAGAVAVEDDASAPAPGEPGSEDGDAGAAAEPGDGGTEATGPTLTALWVWVPVYERMDTRSPKLGYLRAGAIVRRSAEPTGTEGCARGWYQIEGDGYVCLNRMSSLNPNEFGRRRPTQPDLSAPMPYEYLTSYRSAVMYRWLPSVADMREMEPERFNPTPPAAVASASPDAGAPVGTAQSGAADAGRAAVAAADAGVRLEDLQGASGTPLLRRMLAGMYISVDREATSAGRRFWRTQNGGYVERSAVGPLRMVPPPHGVVIDDEHPLPIAFMTAYEGWTYELSSDGRSVSRRTRAPRLSSFHLTEDPPITVGRMQYYRTREGQYLSARNIRLVQTVAPPAEVGPDEKWIEVNLDRQMVIAYQGARPLFVTLVSTGLRNERNPRRNYETVQGGFRVQSKHVATTMDGNSDGDRPYSIEDVPWVLYFENSFATHGAFWHNVFGNTRSHGCVNMAPGDARWIFNFSEPHLPEGWHGVYATASRPGTRIYVHYENQPLGQRGGPAVIPTH